MRKIKWTKEEVDRIKANGGETCAAVARAAMERSELSFDDIEDINEHYENHRWGSNTDRAYKKRAVNKAIMKVAENPLKYAE